jgi:hypothetical protein
MIRFRPAFLTLILLQAAHSFEEYWFRLYEVFPPARMLSGLFTDDLRIGFLVFNVLLVGFGLWCYAWPIRRGWPSARGFAWLWVVIELGNGIVHPVLAIQQGGYAPGVVSALLLGPLALYIAGLLQRGEPRPPGGRTAPFASPDEFFEAVTQLVSQLDATGQARAAAELRDSLGYLNGLTDGYAEFLRSIEGVRATYATQLTPDQNARLDRIRDATHRAVYR